jgi:hypothetical protein
VPSWSGARRNLRQPEEDLIATATSGCQARLPGTAVFLASRGQRRATRADPIGAARLGYRRREKTGCRAINNRCGSRCGSVLPQDGSLRCRPSAVRLGAGKDVAETSDEPLPCGLTFRSETGPADIASRRTHDVIRRTGGAVSNPLIDLADHRPRPSGGHLAATNEEPSPFPNAGDGSSPYEMRGTAGIARGSAGTGSG